MKDFLYVEFPIYMYTKNVYALTSCNCTRYVDLPVYISSTLVCELHAKSTFTCMPIHVNVNVHVEYIGHVELFVVCMLTLYVYNFHCTSWIKFEEDVEEGGERWSKPHVATNTLYSYLQLRYCLQTCVMELDSPYMTSLSSIVGMSFSALSYYPYVSSVLLYMYILFSPIHVFTSLIKFKCNNSF